MSQDLQDDENYKQKDLILKKKLIEDFLEKLKNKPCALIYSSNEALGTCKMNTKIQ